MICINKISITSNTIKWSIKTRKNIFTVSQANLYSIKRKTRICDFVHEKEKKTKRFQINVLVFC